MKLDIYSYYRDRGQKEFAHLHHERVRVQVILTLLFFYAIFIKVLMEF